MLTLIRQHLAFRDFVFVIAFAVSLFLAWFRPHWGEAVFSKFESFGARLARKKALAIFSLGLFPILVRLSLLPLIPVPVPRIHDEFSHLLVADTFAAERLTNPPHPMWMFFDTIHVNQHPTYMSKYPPGQGAILALGQCMGSPWLGVLLSVGIMCGAVLWMLQGWLPPSWALVGGFLVSLRIAIFSYWMNSYWGGAVPAIGGALVVGALPRIIHLHRTWHAMVMGVGVAILMNSRPFEGLILCLPVAILLVVWLFEKRSPSLSLTLPRLVLPIVVVAILSVGFIGYYNWRGTGNAFLMPYMLNERTYWSTPTLLWQKQGRPIHFANPQFEEFYNGWSHDLWLQGQSDSIGHAARHISAVIMKFVYFFLWPELCVPLIAVPWMLSDRRVRFLMVQTVFCLLAFLMVAWFQPHYGAPLTASLFALLAQAIRHLRRWEYHGSPVGVGLVRVVVLFAAVLSPFHPHAATLGRAAQSGIDYRAQFEARLNAIPGNHLVIVRYSLRHDALTEWVYNRADIDQARVIWAREIPGVSLLPLLDYFCSRRVWVVEPDLSPPRLTPYTEGLGPE